MLLQHRRDLDRRDLVHHLVHVLALLQSMGHLNDMDRYLLERRYQNHQNVVDIANQNQLIPKDVEKMDELQILDAQNLDEDLTFQVEVHHFLADVQVDVELRHL